MTDYCQAHFDGAWWYTDLADTLAHRLRVGQGRFDAELAHINVLRNSCRGWWTWVDGTTTGPVFSEDAPKAPRAAKKPAPRRPVAPDARHHHAPQTCPRPAQAASGRRRRARSSRARPMISAALPRTQCLIFPAFCTVEKKRPAKK
ncbi:hypothetical protein TW95_gp0178 [Pandoravirus inopinatum]|uniref:Uncharacterized protein n=1 Tax=Pandoravirus inopinatum TaxID=1605721 RepID=A0A0B5JBH2_9VIRU|nr:hypothetical protein TW95_gp0178 [Pandoravirus inopinatum]AJF96912.1 hypothetical protein [Pandoravirus inopinatum]